jgi:hypothetical protein
MRPGSLDFLPMPFIPLVFTFAVWLAIEAGYW